MIQPTVTNVKFELFDIYIGRSMPRHNGYGYRKASDWQNSHQVSKYGRTEALARYEVDVRANADLMSRILPELTGKRLGCWCRPAACHGDVLVKIWRELAGQS